MISLLELLGTDAHDALMRGIARGRYQVLLGAGASASSTDKHNIPLPMGGQLRDDIVAEFGMAPTNYGLKRVYQVAKNRRSQNGRTIDEYLRDRYTETNPALWYDQFLKMQWAGIWTLNIDDCLERASNRISNRARQKLVSISWTDKHRIPDNRRDEVLAVHLHGKASRAKRVGELVFDITAYVNSLTSQHRWMKIFGDEFPASPFLVIGASLDEEIDLQATFEEGRLTGPTEHPSIILLKSMDEFQEEEYKGYGLIPIACTAEEFFEAVEVELPSYIENLAPDEILEKTGLGSEAMRFLEQWKRLSLDTPSRPDRHHDLYSGHEPRWHDAVHDLISPREAAASVVNDACRRLSKGKHSLTLLTGEVFSGKSSLLLNTCRSILDRGYTPYVFEAEQSIDVDAAYYWVNRVPKSVLVLDNASDFVQDVAKLLEDPRNADTSLRIILADRISQKNHIEKTLIAHVKYSKSVSPVLKRGEIEQLIKVLESNRRLGVITRKTPKEKIDYFYKHDRKLFSAMAALEDGRGYKARVTDEFDRVSSPEARQLLTATCLASRLGYHLPLDVIKVAAGVNVREVDAIVQDRLSDLLLVRDGFIMARHRIFGELLIEYLGKTERLKGITDLAQALAPHLSPAAIRNSTLHYRVARSLMSHRAVLEVLGNDHVDALTFYREVEDGYEWNARFWEQRALLAAANKLFEPAFSWALQAVKQKEDAYTLNTVGVVLMQRALHEAYSGVWPANSFDLAVDYLTQARELEGPKAEYPIDSFFSYTMRLLDLVPDRDRAVELQVVNLWAIWYRSILGLDAPTQMRLEKTRKDALDFSMKAGFDYSVQ